MPVLMDIEQHDHHLFARLPDRRAHQAGSVGCLDIGLINNMPDSALISTERQLFDLLEAAAGPRAVRLHLYTMPRTPRSHWGQDYVRRHYRSTSELVNGTLDGIIVTGAEPKAAHLTGEPYWDDFCTLVDWASENTFSSIYSCLAVHGVVLHTDGVERSALPAKCIGVFTQTKTIEHPLTDRLPNVFRTPHARWNEVREEDLSECGYSILSKSTFAGVDCFAKARKNSLFVHFQGHPEYETQSLLGEFRRDMGRFLRAENDVCPTVPTGYFDTESEALLVDFRVRALSGRNPELLASFPAERVATDLRNAWRRPARQIYRNWLSYLETQHIGRIRQRLLGSARFGMGSHTGS